jgi:hypothetical protein
MKSTYLLLLLGLPLRQHAQIRIGRVSARVLLGCTVSACQCERDKRKGEKTGNETKEEVKNNTRVKK